MPREHTYFGFREVPLERKQGMVDDVFHSVAPRYDLMNDLISGGLHRAWKQALVTTVNPPKERTATARDTGPAAPRFTLLDLAGGTGDIAFRVIQAGGRGPRANLLDTKARTLP